MKHIFLAVLLALSSFAGAAQAEQIIAEPLELKAELAAPAAAAEKQEAPFFMPVPEGWNTETITFPLGFAPELDYAGFEELRFAPGMFKPENDDFWTYAFVWWIPGSTTIDATVLQRDLDAYYGGLAQAVAEGKTDPSGISASRSKLSSVGGREGTRLRFEGTIDTFDAFVTLEPMLLNVLVEVIACMSQDQFAVFFEVSRQPTDHPVWTTLQEIREGFRCEQ